MLVDAHLDLAYNRARGRDITQPAALQPIADNEIATVGLPDLLGGRVAMICATIFAAPKSFDAHAGYDTPDEAQVQAWTQLQYYQSLMTSGHLDLVAGPDDVPTSLPADGRLPFVLLLEGADPLRTPDDLPMWYDAGLRVIGMAWKQTRYAGGTGMPGPLTPLGVDLAKRMDRLGLIHDASHLAEESFWQLCSLGAPKLIASHSNCRAIADSDRQLSDAMIKEIAARGGVIGINYFHKFLLPKPEVGTRRATLADVLAHIRHICDLTGSAKHVGLGTDMDGGLGREQIPHELTTSADLPKLADTLSAANFSDPDIASILGGNFLTYFRTHLPTAQRAIS